MPDKLTLKHGDCFELLRELEDCSVDSVITDPPYGIGFMGETWDSETPVSNVWAECLRVMKPGAFLCAFASPRTYHRTATAVEDAGLQVRDQLLWLYGTGFPKGKSNLKPAHEPAVLAWKPPESTIQEASELYGTGILNIEAARIPAEKPTGWQGNPSKGYAGGLDSEAPPREVQGRYPANVCHDGSAGVIREFPAGPAGGGRKGEIGKRSYLQAFEEGKIYNTGTKPWLDGKIHYDEKTGRPYVYTAAHQDFGSAARFFYCAKASQAEREEGANGITHPTVKPIRLMAWLCNLLTSPGGLILDPFMGSGTTGIAAALNGYRFHGIEREEEYLKLATARISHYAQNWQELESPVKLQPAKNEQRSLF